jgi:hypothetical protein
VKKKEVWNDTLVSMGCQTVSRRSERPMTPPEVIQEPAGYSPSMIIPPAARRCRYTTNNAVKPTQLNERVQPATHTPTPLPEMNQFGATARPATPPTSTATHRKSAASVGEVNRSIYHSPDPASALAPVPLPATTPAQASHRPTSYLSQTSSWHGSNSGPGPSDSPHPKSSAVREHLPASARGGSNLSSDVVEQILSRSITKRRFSRRIPRSR